MRLKVFAVHNLENEFVGLAVHYPTSYGTYYPLTDETGVRFLYNEQNMGIDRVVLMQKPETAFEEFIKIDVHHRVFPRHIDLTTNKAKNV